MEMVYQYMWKHRLIGEKATTDGRRVEVISPGRHNSDAGPDFYGARIRIGGEEWGGTVEVHVKASDWHRHGHESDPAYDNVILHVVGINDARIPDRRGGFIPQVVVSFPEPFIHMYSRLAEKISEVACSDRLCSLPEFTITSWLETLAVERMQQKSRRIIDTLTLVEGDWERACFITFARALGFSLNSEPFEMLARSVPLSVLAKHSDDIMQLEAILFGQAGMLDQSVNIFDEYYQSLCREYGFLARKYGLRPMRRDLWKFSRTRPQNFPTRRIAILARALHGGFSLLSRILDRHCDGETAAELFAWKIEGYWETRFDFDRPASGLSPKLADTAASLLVINFIAPLLYAYGSWRGDVDMAERGLDIWRDTDAENNKIIRTWKTCGINCDDAAQSQALIQLHKEYCDRNRCLDCQFGHALLRDAYQN